MLEDVTDRAPCFDFYFRQIHAGPHRNFTYVIGDAKTRTAAIIDPVFELDAIFGVVERDGYRITHAFVTHSHDDHAGGIPDILGRAVKTVVLHDSWLGHKRAEACGAAVQFVQDEAIAFVGSIPFQLLHTPGHTPDAACILVGAAGKPQALFGGDTLLMNCCGRCDVSQVEPAAAQRQMFDSLQRLKGLRGDIHLFPGHFYTGFPNRELQKQMTENPALAVVDYDTWSKFWFLREYD